MNAGPFIHSICAFCINANTDIYSIYRSVRIEKMMSSQLKCLHCQQEHHKSMCTCNNISLKHEYLFDLIAHLIYPAKRLANIYTKHFFKQIKNREHAVENATICKQTVSALNIKTHTKKKLTPEITQPKITVTHRECRHRRLRLRICWEEEVFFAAYAANTRTISLRTGDGRRRKGVSSVRSRAKFTED